MDKLTIQNATPRPWAISMCSEDVASVVLIETPPWRTALKEQIHFDTIDVYVYKPFMDHDLLDITHIYTYYV